MVVSGESLAVFYKVIVHPARYSSAGKDRHKYELRFKVQNEYAEDLLDETTYLRLTPPVASHTFILRTHPA